MPKKLPYDIFLKTFDLVPRVALSLIISDSQNKVLLTKRDIPPFPGSWHIPGSFLLKNESINDCLMRVAKKELGFVLDVKKTKLLGVFEDLNKDPRGHVIDIMYGYKMEYIHIKSVGDSEEIRFFAKLPPNISFNHRETLIELGFK